MSNLESVKKLTRSLSVLLDCISGRTYLITYYLSTYYLSTYYMIINLLSLSFTSSTRHICFVMCQSCWRFELYYVLSCLVLLAFAVWTDLVTSQYCQRLKISKQFCPVSKCGVNWVLSCPDPVSNSQRQYDTYCDVIFGNWIESSSQMLSHRRQDRTKLFSLQYIENYWKLSATVADSVHTTDKTRRNKTVLSCRCRRCELCIRITFAWTFVNAER